MKPCLQILNTDLVFGSRPHKAFALLDQGRARLDIQQQTHQIVAIHDVSLDVFPGEILVLMGLSGSGKSSLLRCLNGLNGREHGKLRGKVLFNGNIDLQRCSNSTLREVRRHQISMVFQQFALMPWLSLIDNVAFPLKLQGIHKSKRLSIAHEKLELVGLKDWVNRTPSELSGGMQQRVGLARAFATNAPILLMDEPFSALDPLHRQNLRDELLRLQQKLSKTIVFVTHDFNEAIYLADRLAVMEEGRVLQVGPPDEILHTPNCAGVSKFVTEGGRSHVQKAI